jgi:hypothetical protein
MAEVREENSRDATSFKNPPNDDTDLLRGFSSSADDVDFELDADAEMSTLVEENVSKNFQPGDHVIRWKMIKVMLWPIQIHGIVLSVEETNDGSCSVVIADFGYSSTEDGKKKRGFRNIGNINGMKNINGMMKNFYEGKGKKDTNEIPPNLRNDEGGEEDEEDIEKEDGKRFHLRTITDPKILKKWSKVNYGQSLFSSKGKLDKIKKLFKIPNKQKTGGTLKPENESSTFDENDDYFKSSEKISGDENDNGGIQQSSSLEELISEANKVDQRSRNRPIGFLRKKNSHMSENSGAVSKRPFMPPNFKPPTMKGVNNIMKKLTFQNKKAEEYDTLPSSASNEEIQKQEEPKLPKSDPRAIVVARVKFVLAEQEKSEDESSLPKYHILYSNSECLAVWCKTGRFSTLQAAVFLHSTAVGNAKSSIMIGAGVAATQPWLIPVVGVYAVAAVGMPYYILNKCKNKWKEGEMRLTHGFWETADNEVFISAIQNWSGLCPEDEEDSDEIEGKTPTPAESEVAQIVQV